MYLFNMSTLDIDRQTDKQKKTDTGTDRQSDQERKKD